MKIQNFYYCLNYKHIFDHQNWEECPWNVLTKAEYKDMINHHGYLHNLSSFDVITYM